jgi:hypothetical protein
MGRVVRAASLSAGRALVRALVWARVHAWARRLGPVGPGVRGLASEMGSFFGELDDAANMLPDKGIANPRRATHHGRLHLP